MKRFLLPITALLLVGQLFYSACSDDESTTGTCDPNVPSCTTASYCAGGTCAPCPVGTYNCSRTGTCTDTTACAGGTTCTPSAGASTCPENQYCSAQSCVDCPTAGTFNCDKNDNTACEQSTPCNAGTACTPSDSGGSTCGYFSYCSSSNTCAACNPNTFNCDKADANMCEKSTPCTTSGNCTPSESASSCGTSQYCGGINCATCQSGMYNCDKNDNNSCESSTPCSGTEPPAQVNAHFEQACQDTLYQVNITEGASSCGTVDTYLQITVRDANGLPTAGRTYTMINQTALPSNDGQAIGIYVGPAGSGAIDSGTFTVTSVSGTERTGSYDLRLATGMQVTGGYRADECPFNPADC